MVRFKKAFSLLFSLLLILSAVPVCSFTAAASGNVIYVSPSGSDSASGTIDAPLKTLEGAKQLAKSFDGDITVYFREGSYTMTDTVAFSASDKSDVTYKAYNGEKVVFTSGKAYSGFEECEVNGVRTFKKNVGTDASFNVLFNDETTLRRPRYPESGYLYVKDVLDSDWLNHEDTSGYHRAYTACIVNEGDIADFRNSEDVVIRMLHFWKDEMLTVKSYDASSNRLEFSRPTSMRVQAGDRYFLENVFEALDQPGEWYLDKTDGVLYYIPEENEKADELTLWGSETETMITVDGVDGISFENIIFRGNGFNIPRNNTERDLSPQAAYDATPCVSYENAGDFYISGCEFRDIAACAVFFGSGVQNAAVDSTYFENLGAQAVYIRGENVDVDAPNVTKNISITNNCVSGYGKCFFNAVGVLVIHANTVNISHNEIHDGYYTAISVGWVWGYGYNVTYNNSICDNLIYDIGQGWLSDMGGIYMLGNQPGTVISGNVIHNVSADPGQGGYGGWGIYLDEGSGYMTVEKNLVYACGSNCYHLHYGIDNIIRNNIFAFGGEGTVRVVSKSEKHNTASFENNIILTDSGSPVLTYMQSPDLFDFNGNILWDMTNKENVCFLQNGSFKKAMSVYEAEVKGYISAPLLADPGFKDAKNYDFTLNEESTAVKNGFEMWDYNNAGTIAGATVGVSLAGGTTAYNDHAAPQVCTAASRPLSCLIKLFYKVILKIKNVFSANFA